MNLRETLRKAVERTLGDAHHWSISRVIVSRLETCQDGAGWRKGVVGMSFERLKWHTQSFLTLAERKSVWNVLRKHCPKVGLDNGEVTLGLPYAADA